MKHGCKITDNLNGWNTEEIIEQTRDESHPQISSNYINGDANQFGKQGWKPCFTYKNEHDVEKTKITTFLWTMKSTKWGTKSIVWGTKSTDLGTKSIFWGTNLVFVELENRSTGTNQNEN